ncbi:MAG: adenosylcobinamide-GDP ribazoletransferase [Syntrophobacteraceae bacterium]|nr:adenosylcobinamide-GDP ribazoletransferase [Syntrophobacteraceae bacterium]
MWKSFATALTFLTVIPVPFYSPGTVSPTTLARSFSFFPIVGLTLGLCCLAPALLLSPTMPPLLLAVSITAFMAGLTRALHLDGLADLADAAWGGYCPQRRLEIMKDSRTGAFGVIALVLVIFVKAAAIDAILRTGSLFPLVLAPVFSRWAMAATAYRSPYARPEGGLGKPFLEHMAATHLLTASLLTLIIALLVHPASLLIFTPLTAGSVVLLRFLSSRWLGGITGDVLGAVNELTEAVLLCAAASMAWQ